LNTSSKNIIALLSVGILIMMSIYGCSSQRDTITNRKLQNLSARYNLIYNSNVLLDEYLEGVNLSKKENFNNFLPLYYAPARADVNAAGTNIKELDAISQKARTIVAEKNYSNYIDDAYILLGKADFYQGKYYNATEYFNYVANAFKKDHNIYLNALNWQARTLMELNEIEKADNLLELVKVELDSVKRKKAEPLATLAQMSIVKEDDKQAIYYLEKALKAGTTSQNKINWTYTLAQLYENEKQFEKSLKAYQKVEKSNAPFEIYFNAKLSKIRINEALKGEEFDRKLQLTKMLKDEKNIDFLDQIYYEIANDYYAKEDFLKAEENYKLSAKKSTVNNIQKGLSFLKIADLNFKHYSDYVTAKLYYDSTVTALPTTHPLHQTIKNKAQNLAYLQERYASIALQDSLQKIALLPASERETALKNYLEAKDAVSTLNTDSPNSTNTGRASTTYTNQSSGGTFYFANSAAVGRGFNEFIKRWGNRKLTNNWRQSAKPSGQNQQDGPDLSATGPSNLPTSPDQIVEGTKDNLPKASNLLDSLPITPALLEQSNQKIIAAYLEMGSFYQQVLKDKPEAIKTYEALLKRFPNNSKLDVIYYSLYLANQEIDNNKANTYKNLVLNQYPSSVYAKTIIDPNFSAKQNNLEATLKREYEVIFGLMNHKDYAKVIASVDDINQRFPGNELSAQYDYLKAIAVGRTQNVDELIGSFNKMIETHKTDKLIKPLVEQHLAYINAHLSDFKRRKIALTDYDPNEIPFGTANNTAVRMNEPVIANLQNPTGKKITQQTVATQPAPKKEEPKPTVVDLPKKEIEVAKTVVKKDSLISEIAPAKPTELPNPIKDDLFNPASSDTYLYVIAVRSNLSVSTSRFGIGQFNRGNYSGANLRHQLKEMEKDQLIIVGNFGNIGDVQQYQQNIKSQLGVIMKVPVTTYTTFAISKENLAKITDRETLDRYIRYINSNEL
jgi:tetratricopeptide (TPR) repeat protein